MATGAAEIMLRCVFDGTLSVYNTDIERRPYHRNCSCALHTLKGACSNPCFQHRKISYPKKQSWTGCSSSISASKLCSQSFISDSSVQNRKDSGEALSSDDRNSSCIC